MAAVDPLVPYRDSDPLLQVPLLTLSHQTDRPDMKMDCSPVRRFPLYLQHAYSPVK